MKNKKKNVILVNIDGCRADSISGVKEFEELKKHSSFFSNAVTYAPYTVGSLHAIFSGMYGSKNGVDSYYGSRNFRQNECKTLTEYFKDFGYFTAADGLSDIILPSQSFDHISIHDEFHDDLTVVHENLLEKALKTEKPFFVFLQYSGIHKGYVQEYAKKVQEDFDSEYFSSFEKNNHVFKKHVKESGPYLSFLDNFLSDKTISQDTILIVFSDHGTSNGEKKGEKIYGVYCYDYTLSTFVFLKNEELFEPKIIPTQARLMDIMPTLLESCNIKTTHGFLPLQAKSLFSAINGKETEDRLAFSETGGLGGPFPSPSKPNVKSVRMNDFKLIYSPRGFELYDLKQDSKEEKNVFGQGLEKENLLMQELKKFTQVDSTK